MANKEPSSEKSKPNEETTIPSFLLQIAELSPNLLFVIEVPGHNIIYVNKKLQELLRLDPDAIYSTGPEILKSVLHPDDYGRRMDNLEKCSKLGDGEESAVELRLDTGEKGWQWFRVTDKVFSRDEAGAVLRIIGTAQNIHEQKTGEEKLREEHRRLTNAQAIGHIGTFERKLPGDQIYYSEEFYNILGLEPRQEPISLQEFMSHVHPEDRKAYREAIDHTHTTGEPLDMITRIIRSDDDIRFVHRRAAVITNEEGVPQRVYGTVQDITERVKAEEERERMENLMRSTEKVAQTGSYEADLRTSKVYFSDGLFRIFGEEPGAFEPSTEWIDSRSHPDDTPIVRQILQRAAENRQGYSYTRRIYRKDGLLRIIESHGSVLTNAAGEAVKFIGLVQDITERRQAEEELRKSESRSRSLLKVLQNAPDAYLVLTADLHIELVSDAYLEATHNKREQIIGRYMFDAFPDNPAVADATGVKNLRDSLERVISSREPHRMNIQHYDVRLPDGSFEEKYWSPVNTPVINSAGEVEYIIHRVLDLTDVMKKQAAVKDLAGEAEMLKTSLEEIKLQAEQIKESRALLKSVFDASPNSISLYRVIYDNEGDIKDFEFLMLNSFTLNLLGVDSNIIGKRLMQEFPHLHETEIPERFKNTMVTGMPADFETRYEGEGLNHWLHFRATKLNDILVVTTEDITERKTAAREVLLLKEELAQRAIDRYTQLFNSIDEGFCTIELIFDENKRPVDFRFIDVNPAFEKHTGLQDVLDRTIKELVPDIETDILDNYGRVALSGNPIRLELPLSSMNRWFDIYAFQVDAPEDRHVAILFYDITDRKLEEERQKYLLKLSDALRPLTDPIEIKATAAKMVGEHLGSDRSYYVEIERAADEFIVACDWHKTGAPGHAGRYAFKDNLVPRLIDGKTLVVQDTESDPSLLKEQREANLRYNIGATVVVPLIKQGQLEAAFVVNQQQAREWMPVEVNLVEETAERTWAAVERARAEAALREAHERTVNILESTSDAFYAVDADFNFTYINKKAAQLWGRDPQSVIGRHYWREFPEAIGSESYHKHFEVLQTGRPVHYETISPLIHTWIEVSIYPGQRGSLSVFFRDISERKEAEERQTFLLKLGDVLRSLADPAELQDAVTEEAMNFFKADRCYFCEIEGDSAIIRRDASRGDLSSMCGTYALGTFSMFKKVVDTGSPVIVPDLHTTEFENDDLKQIWLEKQIVSFLDVPVIKEGRTVGILCLVQSRPRDWTCHEVSLAIEIAERAWAGVERARAEFALRQSRERLQKVLTIDTVGVLFFDMQSRFLDTNEAFLRMIGHTPETFKKGEIKSEDVTLPEWMPRTREVFRELKETGRFSPYEKELIRPDGTRWWGRFAGMRLSEEECVEFVIDITETKQVEHALTRAKEKAEAATIAKEDFVSTMSHEIRTPLNAVIGLTNLLLERNPREDQRENLNSLSFSAKNLLALINDILDFSKLEAGKMEVAQNDFNLPDLLHSLVQTHQPQARANKNKLELNLDPSIPQHIATDQVKLSQILHNLVSNAVKFTTDGFVGITAELDRKDEGVLWLDFAVQDTGIGIPEDKVDFIFEKFTQAESSTVRQYGGTGLGLSITKLLLGLLGGELKVETAAGKGSTFYFSLPVKKASTEVPEEKLGQAEDITDLGNFRILLVEDVEINRKIIIQFLQNWWQLQPDEATNGEEAVELAKEREYDLILMDVRMPQMDGYEASKKIKQLPLHKDTPILALTADKNQQEQQTLYSTPFDGLLTKPFEPGDLKQKILRYLPVSGKLKKEQRSATDSSGVEQVKKDPVRSGDFAPDTEKRLQDLKQDFVKAAKQKNVEKLTLIEQQVSSRSRELHLEKLSAQVKTILMFLDEDGSDDQLEQFTKEGVRLLNEAINSLEKDAVEPSFDISRYTAIANHDQEVFRKLIDNSIRAFRKYKKEFTAAAEKKDREKLSDLVHKNITSLHFIQANRLSQLIKEYRNLLEQPAAEQEQVNQTRKAVLQEFEVIIEGLESIDEKAV